MLVKIIKTIDKKEGAFLRENASVFLFSEWLDIFDKENVQLCGIYDKGDNIVGAFCIYIGNTLKQKYIATPQFFANNGLFYINPTKHGSGKNTFTKKIKKAISKFLVEQKTLYVSIGFPSTITDVQPFIWDGFNTSLKYTYHLDITKDQDILLSEFTSERRKNIRKAEKDGIKVKQCKDATILEELIMKTINRQEAPLDKAIAKKILHQFITTSYSYAFVAYKNDKPSACVFIVHDRNTAYYLLGGYDENNKHEGSGAMCMWEAIKLARNKNIPLFDFEGSSIPEVEKYFRGFGGELVSTINVHSANFMVQTLLKSKGRQGF